MKTSNKGLDFNIDLIPVISLFSVCVCFLLLTAVWVEVGTLDVKQAQGGQSLAETPRVPMLNIKMLPNGTMEVSVRDSIALASKYHKAVIIKNIDLDLKPFVDLVNTMVALDPALRGATLEPYLDLEYEKMISVMDALRQQGIVDLGVVAL